MTNTKEINLQIKQEMTEKIQEKIQEKAKVQPIHIYEDIIYGQKVWVKRFASNIPIVDLTTFGDDFIVSYANMDEIYSSVRCK